MKHCALFLMILPGLFFYTNGYSGDSSLLPSPGSMQSESSIGFSGHTTHYLILANGMSPSETPETQPPKDRPPKDKYERDKARKKVIEPSEEDYEIEEADEEFAEETETINDPWEPFNRAMFKFNDKLYFWVLKPAARGYKIVLPEKARISIRKFLLNAATPVRLVNCALQGKMKGIATVSARFTVNSTLGVGGFFDPAQSLFHLKEQEVDFDQTLCLYGMKPIIYINWPLLGASSLRGTFGLIADTGCEPTTYLLSPLIKVGIEAYDELNEISLTIGDYEDLKESALDPYIAIRNAYFQNRRCKTKSQ